MGWEDKNRPVTKVINLLKDMQAQLEKEQKEDEEVYERVACWCETNDKEKTDAISDAEARITDLTSNIEEATASSSRLNTEIKNLEAEIGKNQEALGKATAIREKELAEFTAEEKDMLQSKTYIHNFQFIEPFRKFSARAGPLNSPGEYINYTEVAFRVCEMCRHTILEVDWVA